MQDNDEISVVRRWIAQQRVDIVNEIAKLRNKLETFADMEKMLNKQAPPLTGQQPTREPIKILGKRATTDTLLALEAAGAAGLTSKEYAEVAQLAKGTASARLSLLKSAGYATLDNHKYFVVHSTQEDNNADQSA